MLPALRASYPRSTAWPRESEALSQAISDRRRRSPNLEVAHARSMPVFLRWWRRSRSAVDSNRSKYAGVVPAAFRKRFQSRPRDGIVLGQLTIDSAALDWVCGNVKSILRCLRARGSSELNLTEGGGAGRASSAAFARLVQPNACQPERE